MDIIIFSGQSNMQGETESRPIVKNVENAFEYYYLGNELIPLNYPVGETFYGSDGQTLLEESWKKKGSLVPEFCKQYIKTTGRSVVAVHASCGSTTISMWQKGTERYDMLIKKINKGIERTNSTEKVEKVFFVWLQGESDAVVGTSKKKYAKLLTTFKNDLMADTPVEKFFIIKVGYFASQAGWLNEHTKEEYLKFDKAIMSAQESVVKADSDFYMLTRVCPKMILKKENVSPDCDGHYCTKASIKIGKIAGNALGKYLINTQKQ